jgi:hypothetical protein
MWLLLIRTCKIGIDFSEDLQLELICAELEQTFIFLCCPLLVTYDLETND